jgi:hypothetical protein
MGGLKSKMSVVSSKSGVTKMSVIALVVIVVVVAGVAASYVLLFQPPSSSVSPSTNTHTVDWATMAAYQTDFWDITMTSPYTVVLDDSMTVSSGSQWLSVQANNSTQAQNGAVWQIYFMNSSSFQYTTFSSNGSTLDRGQLGCTDGVVQVVVTNTTITFIGTTSATSNVPFTNLGQIATSNGDGDFNGGELKINVQESTPSSSPSP